MKLSEEQIQTLLAAAGLLGPHARIAGQPNNGTLTVLGIVPCTTVKTYKFDVQFIGRNPANGQTVTEKHRITVVGSATAPAAVGGDIISEAAVTNMANPPVFTLAVSGVNLELRVNNPVAGSAADVEAIIFGPYISS